MDAASASQADLGDCGGKVHDRSHLVVLSFLDSGLFAAGKWAMFLCSLCVLPIAVVYRLSGLWPATLLIGLAAAGHQGFSANLFTLASDLFPSRAVASVAGIAGMAGEIGRAHV